MAIPLAIPVAGAALAAAAVGLRLRAVYKEKQAAGAAGVVNTNAGVPVTPEPVVKPSDTFVQLANKLGGPAPAPVPGKRAPTLADLIAQLRDPAGFAAANPDVSFDNVPTELAAAAKDAFDALNTPKTSAPGVAPAAINGKPAVVTTNDKAPEGDLRILASANATAKQIGGAEKYGTVYILESSDPTFAKIRWDGGTRWPACTGYARKAYLKLV